MVVWSYAAHTCILGSPQFVFCLLCCRLPFNNQNRVLGGIIYYIQAPTLRSSVPQSLAVGPSSLRAVCMLFAVLLQILVLGACRDTVPEQHEKGQDDEDDPIKALWKALDLLLFPSNEAFRDFRDQFITIRFLAPFAVLVLVQLGSKLVQKLVEPCFVHGPDDIDIEKPWSVLTEDEKQRISDEPLKWLGKRYYINFVARLLYPPLRLVFFHVAPCLLVLRCSWNEVAESAWQLFVKAVLTSLYGLYLPLSLRCFANFGWKVLQGRDQHLFLWMFLLPFNAGWNLEVLWNLHSESPVLSRLYDVLIWGGLGLEFTVFHSILTDNKTYFVIFAAVFLPMHTASIAAVGFISLSCCLLCSAPGFWNYMGAFLLLTPAATYLIALCGKWCKAT